MTDNFEFAFSNAPQGLDLETPYASKNWNFIQDNNNGSYTSQGTCLVTINATNLNSADTYVNFSEAYLAVPITIVSSYVTTAGALVAPIASSWASNALKGNNVNLLHQFDLQCDGVTREMDQPFVNEYCHIRMLSQMSQDDLNAFGSQLGLGDKLDNWQSMQFYGSANCTASTTGYPSTYVPSAGRGNGMVNNQPFAPTPSIIQKTMAAAQAATGTTLGNLPDCNDLEVGMLVTGTNILAGTFITAIQTATNTITLSVATTTVVANGTVLTFYNAYSSNQGDSSVPAYQYLGCYNAGLYSRMKRMIDMTGTSTIQNFYGSSSATSTTAISNVTLASKEAKAYYSVQNTNYMVWQDVAMIRLQDISETIKNIGIVKYLNIQLRLYFNVGYVCSAITNQGLMAHGLSTNTFAGTCPLIQTNLGSNVPNTAGGICSQIYIGSPTNTSISFLGGNINLGSAGISHYLPQVRLYYPKIKLRPHLETKYLAENRAKKVVATQFFYSFASAISSGASYANNSLNAGVARPRGIWIIPRISSTTHGTVGTASSGVTTFSEYISPFSTAPCTGAPISLTNLQVILGNTNVLENTINYGWETFYENVCLYEKTNGAQFSLTCGLFNEAWWSNNRFYYVDLTRGNEVDWQKARSVGVSFNNNSLQTIDVSFYIEYFKEFTLDVATGKMSENALL